MLRTTFYKTGHLDGDGFFSLFDLATTSNQLLWIVRNDYTKIAAAAAAKVEERSGIKRVYFSNCAVAKCARGMGLQQKLIDLRVKYARKVEAEYCWTYVWWGNIPSMRNLIKKGFNVYYAEHGGWLYLKKEL